MKKLKKKVQSKNDLENYYYQMRNTIEDPKLKDLIKKHDCRQVEQAVKDAQSWLEQNHNANCDEFDAKRKELEQICTPIITAAYQSSGEPQGGMGGMPNIDEVD